MTKPIYESDIHFFEALKSTRIIKCPLCDGTGKFQIKNDIKARIYWAKFLKSKGISIRGIMKSLGYKSTRSVTYLLSKSI